MEEKELTHADSLRLIEDMIGKAKNEYRESGVSALLWGSVIMFCSIATLLNERLHNNWLNQVWILTALAIIPQIIISAKERARRRVKSHAAPYMSGIWTAFGISMGLASYYSQVFHPAGGSSIFLILYGIPTFATGVGHRFMPMIIGGIICWICAIASFYQPVMIDVALHGIAAFFAWFLPGLLLRRRYLKARTHRV